MLTRFTRQSFTKVLLPTSSRAFGSVESVAPQYHDKAVRDLRGNLFKPTNKLEFNKDDKCLLYYYRPRFYTFSMMYARYVLPMLYIAKLIANNPFYMTFPVALPIMICTECYLLKKVYEQRKITRNVIGEVYLLRDGETLEIIYHSKFWRKVKSDVTSNYYYIPSLKSPAADDQSQPLKGDLFPSEYPFNELKPAGWAWKKYFRNPRNFFVVPKNANYKNMEVLAAAFSGKVIDTSKSNVVEIDYDMKEKYKFV